MNDIAMYIFPVHQQSKGTAGMQGTFLNALSTDKYLDNIWSPKRFGVFRHFFVIMGLRIGQDLINVRILHH